MTMHGHADVGVRGANVAWGLSWDHGKKIRSAALVVAILVVMAFAIPHADARTELAEPATVSVIVRTTPGGSEAARTAVETLGGHVGQDLAIIGGFVAEIRADRLDALEVSDGVDAVTPDAQVRLLNATNGFDLSGEPVAEVTTTEPISESTRINEVDGAADTSIVTEPLTTVAPAAEPGALSTITREVLDVDLLWAKGLTGAGVDVALVDSGVVPVDGLTSPGKVVNGVDVSYESQGRKLRYLDSFGHGTHMAGIIAGRDHGTALSDPGAFTGVAPDAGIVSVKVADANGAVDVSQVIAAIDWVVQHRNDHGRNIRVLNLSFGTDGVQDYQLDPLAHAVEVAWRQGIVVVVAAGNDGNGAALRNPAHDPYVIAVGAADTKGTASIEDDVIADFSNCGTSARHVDLVAPGASVASLRAPGSNADIHNPDARVGERFFRGSGTSQAAAVVSGAAALLVQHRPDLTPDQVKALLMGTATPLGARAVCEGSGLIDVPAAAAATVSSGTQSWPESTGLGTLEGARGSVHVVDADVALSGEYDIFLQPWDAQSWAAAAEAGTSWSRGTWNGSRWAGRDWSGSSWTDSYDTTRWKSPSWAGQRWSDTLSGKSWSSKSWSSGAWTGKSWSSKSWSSKSWSTLTWGA